jgi:hypothetical protein
MSELIDHTVQQQMISSPFGVEFRQVCTCGWQTRTASIEDGIDAIGGHILDTMPLTAAPPAARPAGGEG